MSSFRLDLRLKNSFSHPFSLIGWHRIIGTCGQSLLWSKSGREGVPARQIRGNRDRKWWKPRMWMDRLRRVGSLLLPDESELMFSCFLRISLLLAAFSANLHLPCCTSLRCNILCCLVVASDILYEFANGERKHAVDLARWIARRCRYRLCASRRICEFLSISEVWEKKTTNVLSDGRTLSHQGRQLSAVKGEKGLETPRSVKT